jgi:hypothetical protein
MLGPQLSAEVGPVPCDDLKGGVFCSAQFGGRYRSARAWPVAAVDPLPTIVSLNGDDGPCPTADREIGLI